MQKFQHCCLCPLPKIKENRNTHFMVLCYKSICPNSKAAGLVQRAVCNVQPHNRCNVMAFTSSHFAAKILQLFCFASDFALTQHLNIYKQMILFKGHIRQIFISLSYNFFVLKVERDTCILFEELKWMRWGKTIRTEKGDTSLCCLSAK